MRDIRIACRIHIKDLTFLAACVAVGWGIGVITALLCMHFLMEPGDGFATIGALFAFFGIAIGLLARGNQNSCTRYALAVSMGQTRRSYLLWDSLASFLECLVFTGVVILLGMAERGLYLSLYPGEEDVLDFIQPFLRYRFALWIVLAACVVFVCLDLLLTALMLRFGRKGMFFFLVPIWVITLIINPALNAVRSNPGSLMSKLGEGLIWLGGFLYGVSGIIAGAALVLVLMGGSVVYLLRAPVRL